MSLRFRLLIVHLIAKLLLVVTPCSLCLVLCEPMPCRPTNNQFYFVRFDFIIAHDKFPLIASLCHCIDQMTKYERFSTFGTIKLKCLGHSSNYMMPRHEQYALNFTDVMNHSNVVIYRNTGIIEVFCLLHYEFNQNGSKFMIPNGAKKIIINDHKNYSSWVLCRAIFYTLCCFFLWSNKACGCEISNKTKMNWNTEK